MDFFETVERRHTTRLYEENELNEMALLKILETANLAPSARNLQSYEIYVIKDPLKKKILLEGSSGRQEAAKAGALLLFLANPTKGNNEEEKETSKSFAIQDAVIAAAYAQLAATALGLDSGWVAYINKDSLKKLGIPDTLLPVALIPIGTGSEEVFTRKRRTLDDIIHRI
ncbi:MAG: nitroreductase family protein [Candidatus Micrarchaeia archaeon]